MGDGAYEDPVGLGTGRLAPDLGVEESGQHRLAVRSLIFFATANQGPRAEDSAERALVHGRSYS